MDYFVWNLLIYPYDFNEGVLREKQYVLYYAYFKSFLEQMYGISYAYGDINWKDKLTSYNGQAYHVLSTAETTITIFAICRMI